jgi:hypothetical protein
MKNDGGHAAVGEGTVVRNEDGDRRETFGGLGRFKWSDVRWSSLW